eukprot:CAMPEP_0201533394 /NCGR_PEP_ID=MMETSP0161_2-20130828/53084_1 /ASSEMBLY_ACC=CAM_ASM_000251 /TAXON_ID=180227 /ORGANISM="Neoparamoeba aestuarina, Strain SoJaBio B1-5/56/2" /LENGTH=143 /DNA_ID=CAMNT_0047937375 /DNA_START=67 /DNA_END=495 /DNA_ORIENTATION=-
MTSYFSSCPPPPPQQKQIYEECEKIYREEIAKSLQKMEEQASLKQDHSLEQYCHFSRKANDINKYMIGGTILSLTSLATNLRVVSTLLSRYPRALPAFAVLGVFTGSSVLVAKCRVHLVDGVITQREEYKHKSRVYSELREGA